jgi:hypothetical protein
MTSSELAEYERITERRYSIVGRPRVLGVMHVWHWYLCHCWSFNLRCPIRFDDAWPAYISITLLGFVFFLDFPDGERPVGSRLDRICRASRNSLKERQL